VARWVCWSGLRSPCWFSPRWPWSRSGLKWAKQTKETKREVTSDAGPERHSLLDRLPIEVHLSRRYHDGHARFTPHSPHAPSVRPVLAVGVTAISLSVANRAPAEPRTHATTTASALNKVSYCELVAGVGRHLPGENRSRAAGARPRQRRAWRGRPDQFIGEHRTDDWGEHGQDACANNAGVEWLPLRRWSVWLGGCHVALQPLCCEHSRHGHPYQETRRKPAGGRDARASDRRPWPAASARSAAGLLLPVGNLDGRAGRGIGTYCSRCASRSSASLASRAYHSARSRMMRFECASASRPVARCVSPVPLRERRALFGRTLLIDGSG
jgi:hypothetical protein